MIREGSRVLRFEAAVLGAVTSERPGVARWSELAVYLLCDGTYILSKVGRSTVAHTEDCDRVTWRMPHWIDAPGDEQAVRRIPCTVCLPVVGRAIDPMLVVEPTRYSVRVCTDVETLVDTLAENRSRERLPRLVADLLAQVAAHVPELARQAETLGVIKPVLRTSTS